MGIGGWALAARVHTALMARTLEMISTYAPALRLEWSGQELPLPSSVHHVVMCVYHRIDRFLAFQSQKSKKTPPPITPLPYVHPTTRAKAKARSQKETKEKNAIPTHPTSATSGRRVGTRRR